MRFASCSPCDRAICSESCTVAAFRMLCKSCVCFVGSKNIPPIKAICPTRLFPVDFNESRIAFCALSTSVFLFASSMNPFVKASLNAEI